MKESGSSLSSPKGEDITPEMGGRGYYILYPEELDPHALYLSEMEPEKRVRFYYSPRKGGRRRG
jgi:hypothetical protein